METIYSNPMFNEFSFWLCVISSSVQLSCSVMSDSVTPWNAAHRASLSITNSRSPAKPMSIESVMPSNHLIICCPLLLLPSVFPSIRVCSSESVLRMKRPKCWTRLLSYWLSWPQLGCTRWKPECSAAQPRRRWFFSLNKRWGVGRSVLVQLLRGCHALSRGSSQPKDRTWVSCIAGRFCTIWATRQV